MSAENSQAKMDNRQATRITRRFSELDEQQRGGLVTFLTAGDPDLETSKNILMQLPNAGADIIELGMPFSDPMADGPAVQASSQRALRNGMTLRKTLELVGEFRDQDDSTPVVLMGYYNPIYRYGVDEFVHDAVAKGVDGLIIVDLPPEEDEELCMPAISAGLHWIRLVTPTTNEARLKQVLANSSGFVYYVSITGVTGTRSAAHEEIQRAITRIKTATSLPVAVGFGIRTPEQAAVVAQTASAAVVGSALVDKIKQGTEAGQTSNQITASVVYSVKELAGAIRAS